jgi:hypothetical protein
LVGWQLEEGRHFDKDLVFIFRIEMEEWIWIFGVIDPISFSCDIIFTVFVELNLLALEDV